MAIIADLFFRVGLSDAKLRADLERTRANVKQTGQEIKRSLTKETREARDAAELLGRSLGVQLPRSVQRFITGIGPVRSLLASAFNAAVVGTFAVAIGAAIVKGVQWFEAMRTGAADLEVFAQALGKVNLRLGELNQQQLLSIRTALRAQQLAVEQKIANLAPIGTFADDPLGAKALGGALIAPFRRPALLKEQAELINQIGEVNAALGNLTKQGLKQAEEGYKSANQAVNQFLDSLENQAATVEQNTILTTVYKGELLKLTEEEAKWAKATAETIFLRQHWNIVAKESAQRAREIREELAKMPEAPDIPGIGLSAEEIERGAEALSKLPGAISQQLPPLKAVNELWFEMKQHLQGISQAGLQGIGDALLGLTSWKQLARQVITDLARMLWYLLVVKPLMGAIFGQQQGGSSGGGGGIFSSIFGGLLGGLSGGGGGGFNPSSSVGGMAMGGPVVAGRMYETHGLGRREFFMPHVNGEIVPGGRSGGTTNVFHIDNRGADIGTTAKTAAMLDRWSLGEFARLMRERRLRTV